MATPTRVVLPAVTAQLPVVQVEPKTPRDELMAMTLTALKDLCREEGIKGYSGKNKPVLVDYILAARAGTVTQAPKQIKDNGLTVPKLRSAIKELGGKNYSGKKKEELMQMYLALVNKADEPIVGVPTTPVPPTQE